MSVEAVQARSMREVETVLAVRPMGVEGGVVSVKRTTVTPTLAAVPKFPAASEATAERVWFPVAEERVFQKTWYGGAVTGVPRFTPSNLN